MKTSIRRKILLVSTKTEHVELLYAHNKVLHVLICAVSKLSYFYLIFLNIYKIQGDGYI